MTIPREREDVGILALTRVKWILRDLGWSINDAEDASRFSKVDLLVTKDQHSRLIDVKGALAKNHTSQSGRTSSWMMKKASRDHHLEHHPDLLYLMMHPEVNDEIHVSTPAALLHAITLPDYPEAILIKEQIHTVPFREELLELK